MRSKQAKTGGDSSSKGYFVFKTIGGSGYWYVHRSIRTPRGPRSVVVGYVGKEKPATIEEAIQIIQARKMDRRMNASAEDILALPLGEIMRLRTELKEHHEFVWRILINAGHSPNNMEYETGIEAICGPDGPFAEAGRKYDILKKFNASIQNARRRMRKKLAQEKPGRIEKIIVKARYMRVKDQRGRQR